MSIFLTSVRCFIFKLFHFESNMIAKVRLREMKFKPIKDTPKLDCIDISEQIELLEDEFKVHILQFQDEKLVFFEGFIFHVNSCYSNICLSSE